jgi:hypothetical protein
MSSSGKIENVLVLQGGRSLRAFGCGVVKALANNLRRMTEFSLVGHDVGSQPACSSAAAHAAEVRRLVIMEYILPGFTPLRLEGKA